MSKDLVLICLLVWLIVYPVSVKIVETIDSHRRTVIEKKESYSDETHAWNQIIHLIIYLIFSIFLYLQLV